MICRRCRKWAHKDHGKFCTDGNAHEWHMSECILVSYPNHDYECSCNDMSPEI